MWNRISIFIFIVFIFSSCSNKLVVRKNKLESDYETVVKYIKENDKNYKTYSIKYTGRFSSPDMNLRFRGLLRIVKGKKVWISVSPMGIEAARILFTPDKTKVINRKENTFFESDYNYFNKKYDIDIDYQLIENILTNRFLLMPEDSKQKIGETADGLIKVDMGGNDSMKQTFVLHPQIKKLTSVIFKDYKKQAKLQIMFSDYLDVESHTLPGNIHISLEKDNNEISIDLNYKKITIDKSIKTPFRIPGKYKQVWP